MKKIIAAFLAFTALTITLLVNRPADAYAIDGSKVQETSSELGTLASEMTEADYESFVSVLQQAGYEIEDEELSDYYMRLLNECNLNRSFESEEEEAKYLMENFGNINRTCVTLPLKAAGETIEDEDISQFYNRFISGLDID